MTRAQQEGLLRHSIILMAANMVGSIANLLFHVVMGHTLSKSEYGILSAMLGIVLVIATPMDALRTAMTHFTALLVQENRPGGVGHLVRRWTRNLAIPTAIVMAVGILASEWIAGFFHLESPLPVILTCLVLGGALLLPLLIGALLGLQSFVWMSICQQTWGVVRLVVGAALVLFFSGRAEWGLAAQLVGVIVSAGLGIWGMRWNLRSAPPVDERVTGVTRYFIRSLLVLAGFGVLMNADIVMVKHFFPDAEEAGLFARAATIGRTMVFFTMPIALALFPKVASEGGVAEHNWKNLTSAIAYVVVLLGAAAFLCSFFAWIPLWIIYNDRAPHPETIRLVRWIVWAMTPLGLTYLLMNFQIAQRRFGPAYFLLACAAGYVAGVAIFHETVWQVVTVLGIVSTLSTVILIAGLPWRQTALPANG